MTDEKIRALIAPILDRINPEQIGTHGPDCYQWHVECLALAIERRLSGRTVPDEDVQSPWTRHGHLIPGRTPDENRPPVARCGGPKLCLQCSLEAGNLHARESARATNVEQPIRDALAECLFIANTRSDGEGPSDEQWRQYHGGKAFGYRRMADAIMAAFPVHSRAAASEPEWEYAWEADEGKRARLRPRGPRMLLDSVPASPEEIARFPKGRRVRRRKATEWEVVEPLPVGGDGGE